MKPLTDHDFDEMLRELKQNALEKDIIKAKFVLSFLEQLDHKRINRMLFEICRSEPDFSIPLLGFISYTYPSIYASFPIIEETLIGGLQEYPEHIIGLLNDEKMLDKTIPVYIAGEIKYEPAVSALIDLLNKDRSIQQIEQYLDALGKIGSEKAVNTICEFLYAPNKDLVFESIKALGWIRSETALIRLSHRLNDDPEIDLAILKTFAMIQNEFCISKLNQYIISKNPSLRNYAKQGLIKCGKKSIPIVIKNLTQQDPDLIIHSLNILGQIGDSNAIAPIRNLLGINITDPNIRFAAYEALANLPLDKGAYILASGLTDLEEQVRIAAAKAINRHYSPILANGIKNMINGSREEAVTVIQAICLAQVDDIFLSLADDLNFQKMAVSILSKTHIDVRTHFAHLLYKKNFHDFANQVFPQDETFKPRQIICVVDDSSMILRIFKNMLHALNYDTILFESPVSALEWLQKEKADLLITDLNMPDIDGMDLSRQVKQIAHLQQMPIILVTSQAEKIQPSELAEVGINEMLLKPFRPDTLKQTLNKVI